MNHCSFVLVYCLWKWVHLFLLICDKKIIWLSHTVFVCNIQSVSVTDSMCLSQTLFLASWLKYAWFMSRFVHQFFICQSPPCPLRFPILYPFCGPLALHYTKLYCTKLQCTVSTAIHCIALHFLVAACNSSSNGVHVTWLYISRLSSKRVPKSLGSKSAKNPVANKSPFTLSSR